MENIKVKISELEQFANIVSLKNANWHIAFKYWYQDYIKTYCQSNCLILVADTNYEDEYNDLDLDELTNSLYTKYYTDILDKSAYAPERTMWWNLVFNEYDTALKEFQQLKKNNYCYLLFHVGEIIEKLNALKQFDREISALDIFEVAAAYYVKDNKGSFEDFVIFMK